MPRAGRAGAGSILALAIAFAASACQGGNQAPPKDDAAGTVGDRAFVHPNKNTYTGNKYPEDFTTSAGATRKGESVPPQSRRKVPAEPSYPANSGLNKEGTVRR